MAFVTKKQKQVRATMKLEQPLPLRDALQLVVKNAYARFDESVDIDIVLGIDAAKGEQNVRGATVLPHGLGKKTRILVFARGEYEEAARAAGADYIGVDDMIEKILGGWLEFDAAIATPDLMGAVGKVARVLGPRGLLPNKKVGTVTFDVGTVVEELRKGRVSYRNDKTGVLHAPCGRVSFGVDKLYDNVAALVKSVVGSKPATARGRYLKRASISSTMGVGVKVSLDELV